LRKMREQAGMRAPQVAAYLGVDPTQISQMESGKVGVSPERLRSFAAACKCMNSRLIDALAEVAKGRGKGWWEQYRGTLPSGFLEIAEVEFHATEIYTASSTHIPGLHQTGAYAAAVFARAIPPLPRHELDALLAFRIQRQQALRAAAGKPVTAYVHEAALRMQFGGEKVLMDQLEALLEDMERPEIAVRAIPFPVDGPPGSGENMFYAAGPISELDTVQIDNAGGPMFFDAENILATYKAIFDRLDRVALSGEESRIFIRKMLANWG
jgi:transcriptional regulator with XRE-family HTH domain